MAELSVVVPVYGCRDCLFALHRRLRESAGSITPDFELIFVDDRSPDGSWEALLELSRSDPAVRVVRLSRNFGQHAAITAGLVEASGEWVIVTDCDLEDPPEEIPRLHAKAREGYDFVLARRKRRRQSLFRRFAASAYRRLSNLLAGTDVDPRLTNLSIVSRQVVDSFLRLRDQDRQYVLILLWLGFRHTTIDVDQDPRYAGRSSYGLRELIRVAADGIFFQTTKLLRWIVYVGFAVAALGVALAAVVVYTYVQEDPPEGWASLAVLSLILGGFIIASTGVMGLYIGKIFSQVKGRPLYVVDRRVVSGVEAAASTRAEQDALVSAQPGLAAPAAGVEQPPVGAPPD
jgi:polyisoprenyl-phosphate glycosyltransferase